MHVLITPYPILTCHFIIQHPAFILDDLLYLDKLPLVLLILLSDYLDVPITLTQPTLDCLEYLLISLLTQLQETVLLLESLLILRLLFSLLLVVFLLLLIQCLE